MRRILAATLLLSALVVALNCSSKSDPSRSHTQTSSTGNNAGSADAAPSGDTTDDNATNVGQMPNMPGPPFNDPPIVDEFDAGSTNAFPPDATVEPNDSPVTPGIETRDCHLEYLGNWIRCEEDLTRTWTESASFEDCQSECLQDSSCTYLTDYFWLSEVPGCYLYTSTCDAPAGLPFGDGGKTYVKVCTSPEDCTFEYLGDDQWENALRCEDAQAHAQGEYLEKVAAADLAQCQQQCLEREDCTAVADYFAATDFPSCMHTTVPCGTPSTPLWAEEDAGKDYVKVCDE